MKKIEEKIKEIEKYKNKNINVLELSNILQEITGKDFMEQDWQRNIFYDCIGVSIYISNKEWIKLEIESIEYYPENPTESIVRILDVYKN